MSWFDQWHNFANRRESRDATIPAWSLFLKSLDDDGDNKMPLHDKLVLIFKERVKEAEGEEDRGRAERNLAKLQAGPEKSYKESAKDWLGAFLLSRRHQKFHFSGRASGAFARDLGDFWVIWSEVGNAGKRSDNALKWTSVMQREGYGFDFQAEYEGSIPFTRSKHFQ
jgi:hypothetical protein